MSRYTQQQLQQAFDQLLKKGQHWKDPIDKVIWNPGNETKDLLQQACIHFTGSVLEFTDAHGGRVRVRADGYYATIGA